MRVKTMRGRVLDVSRVFAENEYQVALGNAGMNARGDLVDKNGRVLKSREEIAAEYHSHLPKRPQTAPNREVASQVVKTPQQIVDKIDAATPRRPVAPAMSVDEAVEQIDDAKRNRKRKIIDSDD